MSLSTIAPFKIMLALGVGLAWLACRSVCPTDEASGHHTLQEENVEGPDRVSRFVIGRDIVNGSAGVAVPFSMSRTGPWSKTLTDIL